MPSTSPSPTAKLTPRRTAGVHVARLERGRSRGARRLAAARQVDVLADHHRRERLRGQVGDVARADDAAAAQDRDAVGDVEDLVHPVRHVQDARAAAADLAHDLEQPLDLGVRQDRGRLVEDEDAAAGPALEGGGDGDDRALDRRGVLQRPVHVDVHAEPPDERPRGPLLLGPVDRPEPRARVPAAQGQVVDGAELGDEPEVLVDEAQPVVAVADARQLERLAVEPRERARVGRVVAGEGLDERRLATPVLAHERVDLAGRDLERHVAQRARPAERLGQPLEPQHGRRAGRLRLGGGDRRLHLSEHSSPPGESGRPRVSHHRFSRTDFSCGDRSHTREQKSSHFSSLHRRSRGATRETTRASLTVAPTAGIS